MTSAANAAPGICSEQLRVGDKVAVYHYGHYDNYVFVDAYNSHSAALKQDQERHVFHNTTHNEAVDQKCSNLYVNHPGV